MYGYFNILALLDFHKCLIKRFLSSYEPFSYHFSWYGYGSYKIWVLRLVKVLALIDIKSWANRGYIFVIGRLRIIMSAPFALPHVGAVPSASDF